MQQRKFASRNLDLGESLVDRLRFSGGRFLGLGGAACTIQRFATSTRSHRISRSGNIICDRWERRRNRYPPWSIYSGLGIYGEPRGRHGIRARSLHRRQW